MREPAPAKLNLALHVRERRADGYHALETLFAFVDQGDVVSVAPGDGLSLALTGPFACDLGSGDDNLVLRAARLLQSQAGIAKGAALTLDKRLPVASGIGGGSADAAATLRLLDRFWGLDLGIEGLMPIAAALGSDVPACLLGRTAIGTGRGEHLVPIANDLAGTPVLIANPGVALSTAAVFAQWDGVDRGALAAGEVSDIIAHGRNDLTTPAQELTRDINRLLDALIGSGASFARMSGSGATCFALYESDVLRDRASRAMSQDHPHYWTMACRLT
ncbi:4-(cytidine 5'-diphospho)-2-C-methyl-D-erythritol kinase [Sphingorhabdus soli]|uniref:4-diphosphocytidyl-2-C-methyl-D-erythritol kinase n=1 Tax=Flavisphingopyxis soli TaxID=2601267 RepID=A0A5C6U8V1_9SPHN|nr:4-(cytidine 5'-diphospho)-2-C-methyl-D-erythritol kinase [Sphingorhabdus soli]TXC69329.1 4-(cytidine 5'-diphospho)-2-C-methyl-D-erythritol kinase [Sphingorhabdus soli]